jgi:hypothetical protein
LLLLFHKIKHKIGQHKRIHAQTKNPIWS